MMKKIVILMVFSLIMFFTVVKATGEIKLN